MTTRKPEWLLTAYKAQIEGIRDTLKRLLAAIQSWAKAEDAALDARIETFMRANGGTIPEGYDGFSDEDYSIRETERIMFAGLAVAIASAAEPFCKRFVQKLRDAGTTKDAAAAKLAKMTGHSNYNRARILGNCFKHSNGNVSQDYVDTYNHGPKKGDKIDYRTENWASIIDGLCPFLLQVNGT